MNTKFYTKQGDAGITYVGETGYSKSDILFELLGAVDELNSLLGIAETFLFQHGKSAAITRNLQELLFIMQSEIATIGLGVVGEQLAKAKTLQQITDDHIQWLELRILELDSEIPKIDHFVLPGGTRAAAYFDLARAIARRLERVAVLYSQQRLLSENMLALVNRLSSILFALARYENFIAKKAERKPKYKVS
jgi:cob(I)alamin adenosyltransferase